jgi:hypothetical protein
MKKNIFKKLNEFVDYHKDQHLLTELARINNKKEFPYDVFVYGGSSYGAGRNEHGQPHFHFSDNIQNPQHFKLTILIPETSDWCNNLELVILDDESTQLDWTGLRKEKRMLSDWMNILNKIDKTKTNYQMIKIQWNLLNIDNNNVKQIENLD